MSNEKAWYILWFYRTSGTVSPSLFEPYNLNHVSVFLVVTLRLSVLPLGKPLLTYPSRHHLTARVLAYQHTWFGLFFSLTLLSHQSFSFLSAQSFFTKVCFTPPPWVLSPTFHFPLPFSPSWLPSASLLLCLLVVVAREPLSLRNCPCQFVRVSWAEGVFCVCLLLLKGG